MPIFFQQDIDSSTRLAIWRIEEPEDFFSIHLQRTITHPHKRLQHLAGRFLLQQLFPDFPVSLIRIADTRKPFLEDEAYHFSISHCGDFAAVIASPNKRAGIDIEIASEKIERIRHKFLSGAEAGLFHSMDERSFLTLAWSCKEAVFKWYGLGNLDFRSHMQLLQVRETGLGAYEVDLLFKKMAPVQLQLKAVFFGDLCLSYLVTEEQPWGGERGP